MKTQRERDEEKREEKLESIRQQVSEGGLTIRQMTDEERERYGERRTDVPPRRSRPRR